MGRGELPEWWISTTLKDRKYFTLIMGQSPPSSAYNSEGRGLPFFQGKAEFGEIHPRPSKYCTAPSRIAQKDDVLISIRAPVGPTNLTDCQCCIGRGLAAVRCTDKVTPRFLLHALRSMEVEIAGSVQDQGGGFTAIRRKQLEAIEVSIPPVEEQRRIVARIEELTSRVEKARNLQNEAMGEMTSYLPNSYCRVYQRLLDEFDTIPLAQAGQVMSGGTPSKENPVFWGKGIPWVSPKSMKSWWIDDSTDHITPEALEASAARLIPAPAVLFVVRGMILARNVPIAISTRPLAINQDMKAIVPKEGLETEFLASMMRGAEKILLGLVEVAGHGTRKLETDRWGSLPIPVPPENIQREVVRDLNLMQAKAQDLARTQTEMNTELVSFTPALLAKAFRGEL